MVAAAETAEDASTHSTEKKHAHIDNMNKPIPCIGKEINDIVNRSALIPKYSNTVDKDNAAELLQQKIANAQSREKQEELQTANKKAANETPGSGFSWFDVAKEALDSTAGRQVSRTIAREVTRGLFGILGGKR